MWLGRDSLRLGDLLCSAILVIGVLVAGHLFWVRLACTVALRRSAALLKALQRPLFKTHRIVRSARKR